jgi:putative transcriptional regulator
MNRGRPGIPPSPETASPHELDASEAHLASCTQCAAKVNELKGLLFETNFGAATIEPPAPLRERLLSSIAQTPRLEAYVEGSARLLDVSPAQARAYLWLIDDPARWVPTPFGGLEALTIKGGPGTAGAYCGFLRLPPGTSLPHHDHLGLEQGLVLQGRVRDDGGRVYGPGDRVDMEPDSSHELSALPIVDCVFLIVLHGGVRFGDFEFRADMMA